MAVLLFIIFIVQFKSSLLTIERYNNISAICGFPGEPLSTQQSIPIQKVFHSGQNVSYQCVDILGYKQERVCLNGKWSGPQARCGRPENNDLEKVVVKDCRRGHTIAIFEPTLRPNFDRFINSFSTDRYEEEPIRVKNSTCLRWHLYLVNKSNFYLVRTDFVTVFDVSKASREVPVVTAFVGRNKKSNVCRIEAMKQYKHIYTNKWIHFGYKYHFYLTCNATDSELENLLVIETVTKEPFTLDLVRLSVADIYGSKTDPACGLPEMPVGVMANEIREYQSYEMICDEPHFINITSERKTSVTCNSNGFWSGSYPKCKPQKSCDNSNTFKIDSKSLIKSIENVFVYNESVWFAINGTLVHYYCKGKGSEMNIKSKKCLTNGLWDKEESVCDQIDENNKELPSGEAVKVKVKEQTYKPIYAMTAFTSLIVIIIAVSALVLIWRHQRIKENRKEYKDPNEGSNDKSNEGSAQNNQQYKQQYTKEVQCEVIGWTERPVTYIDESQGIYQRHYQSEAIYDVPPNNSKPIHDMNKETELDQDTISEPIYDRPKPRYP